MAATWYGARVNRTPDQIFEDLRTLIARLESLEPDSPDRARLEARRDALRREAQTTSDARLNPDNLRRELEHLRVRLADLDAERVEVPNWQKTLTAGGRLALVNPVADAARINEAIDKASAPDRAAIITRIEHIEDVLGE